MYLIDGRVNNIMAYDGVKFRKYNDSFSTALVEGDIETMNSILSELPIAAFVPNYKYDMNKNICREVVESLVKKTEDRSKAHKFIRENTDPRQLVAILGDTSERVIGFVGGFATLSGYILPILNLGHFELAERVIPYSNITLRTFSSGMSLEAFIFLFQRTGYTVLAVFREILFKSKDYCVINYVIENCTEDILHMVLLKDPDHKGFFPGFSDLAKQMIVRKFPGFTLDTKDKQSYISSFCRFA